MLRRIKCSNATPQALGRALVNSSGRRNIKSVTVEDDLHKVEPVLKMPQVMADRGYKYKEGMVYHGFQCERIEHNSDFGLVSCSLRHIGTGTEFWYIDRNDTNNVFSINFRTPPVDSTGVAHVLEHLALCGSKTFPVRDPFFKMLNRSVATNMNALTGADLTVYIFSSRNEVDFRNIQRIYLDSVFRPNLLYLDFLQEGWRLEHKDLHNRKSEIMIKGIVYNEMKGTFSENSRVFRKSLMGNLLPKLAYNNVAGGDPLEIPNLTHAALIDFHRKYYHPSNARIYCYGSFDLMKTLSFVNKEYLRHKDFRDTYYSRIPLHPRWSQPRNIHIPCRMNNMGASMDRQNQIGVALLMCDRTDVQECFELNVLTELLIRGPNAAFCKGLIEPNFSGGFNKNTGYYFTSRDTYFAVGLQDLRAEDFAKFKELFHQTIHKTIEEGFEPQHIESVLHKLELSVKHQSADVGSVLLYNSMTLWNHGGDVVANLRVSEMIGKLRNSLKENKNYFQQKVEKYFLNNPHKLTVTMSPDELYDENLKSAEKKLIAQKVMDLNADSLEAVFQNGIKLEATQKAKENTDVLPCLSLKDVQEPLKYPQVTEDLIQGVPTQLCKVPTNEITYLNCLFNITGLSREDAVLVPLFCNIIKNIGTLKHNFREFDKLVLSKSAGIDFKVKVVENVKDAKSYRTGLLMTTHALDKNVPDMFALCEELLLNFRLEDTDRLKMLIESYVSKLSLGIAFSGHLYAMLGSAALVSDAAKLKSLLSGVDHIDFMKKYVQQNSMEDIRDKLRNIGSKVFSKSNMRVAINSSEAFQPTALEHYETFLKNLPTLENTSAKSELHLLKPSFKHYVMNIPVNYCAKTFFAVPYLHEDHPVLRVLAKLVSAKYLMPVVREQNGAYGTGARIGYDGLFNFYSYRDPHATKTLDVFDKTYDWLLAINEKLNHQMLFEAKLGVLQLVDWPTAPGEIGLDYFVLGVSHEEYCKYRSRVLSVTVEDIRTIIERYFKEEPTHFGKFILGPRKEKLEGNRRLCKYTLNVTKLCLCNKLNK
ncbi:presequence protease, mitochondrial-like [Drosophila montana]|uniref:presequence protease, mitochondrial-like n=1 Tax=Drosophila montana TaxID=40370 RepID=UPI00313D12E5